MQTNEHNQFAERWLDDALAQYSKAEPRPGLESRILANISVAKATRHSFWRSPLAIASGCAAIISLAVGLAVLRYVYAPAQPVVVAAPLAPRDPVPSTIRTTVQPRPKLNQAQHPIRRPARATDTDSKDPRLPQFPSALPLAGQQSLVLAYVRATPAEELMRVSAEQRAWQERVESGAKATQVQDSSPGPDINRLHFPPLESGNTQADSLVSR